MWNHTFVLLRQMERIVNKPFDNKYLCFKGVRTDSRRTLTVITGQ